MNMDFYYRKMDKSDIEQLTQLDTLNELLQYTAQRNTTKEALYDKSGSLTYQELYESSKQIASRLKHIFDKKQRIAIVADPSVLWIRAFFGIVYAGMTAVLIPPSMPPAAISGILHSTDTDGLVYGECISGCIDEISGKPLALCMSLEEFCNGDSEEVSEEIQVTPETVAAYFFTTGTTGVNKCVPLTHRVIMRNAYNGMLGIPSHSDDRCLAVLPFIHVFGLVRSVISFLYEGGSVYINENIKTLLPNLQWAKPTTLILVPSLAESLCDLAQKRGINVLGGCLRTIITGGSAMKPKTKEDYLKLGINLLQGYGLTEASMICGNTDEEKCFASVGKAYPGTEVKIEVGEILIRGENVFGGYLDPTDNIGAFRDGWYCTGDLGYIDDEGFIYITGRKKFLIITENGENISPEALEARIDALQGVVESLVYESCNAAGKKGIAADIYAPELSQEECEAAIYELNKSLLESQRIYQVNQVHEPLARNAGKKLIRKMQGGS